MIEANEVVPMLLEACPSFAASWAEVEPENLDDDSPTGRLHYLDAGAFVRHLVVLYLADSLEEFPAVFAVFEQLVTDGDDYVRNLGVIGYLEGLQMMVVTNAGIDPEADLRPHLLPVSDMWWDRINRFWAGDATALREDSAD